MAEKWAHAHASAYAIIRSKRMARTKQMKRESYWIFYRKWLRFILVISFYESFQRIFLSVYLFLLHRSVVLCVSLLSRFLLGNASHTMAAAAIAVVVADVSLVFHHSDAVALYWYW